MGNCPNLVAEHSEQQLTGTFNRNTLLAQGAAQSLLEPRLAEEARAQK